MRGLIIAVVVAGCANRTAQIFLPEPRASDTDASGTSSSSEPAHEDHTTVAPSSGSGESEPTAKVDLYPLDEALADALSGPLTYIGTGDWFGIERTQACAYRNDRVIVVNVYCTAKEMEAFRIDVFSPTRGRVSIYAEGNKPVSTLTRTGYFTFKAESEPMWHDAGRPGVSLTMSFAELRAYDERRDHRNPPTCVGGIEMGQVQGGCLRELEPHTQAWSDRNRPFLDRPPEGWYRLIKVVRALVAKDSKRH